MRKITKKDNVVDSSTGKPPDSRHKPQNQNQLCLFFFFSSPTAISRAFSDIEKVTDEIFNPVCLWIVAYLIKELSLNYSNNTSVHLSDGQLDGLIVPQFVSDSL